MLVGLQTLIFCALISFSFFANAGSQIKHNLNERTKQADAIVDAEVTNVEPRWAPNPYDANGPEIIVSDVTLKIRESLKGKSAQNVVLAVVGGQIGDETMESSLVKVPNTGAKGIFFLKKEGSALVPSLEGQGILLLDANDKIRGSDITLDQIKSKIRGGK